MREAVNEPNYHTAFYSGMVNSTLYKPGASISQTPAEGLELLSAGALSFLLRLANRRCVTRQQCVALCGRKQAERWLSQLTSLGILQPMTELTHTFRVNPLVACYLVESFSDANCSLQDIHKYCLPLHHTLIDISANPVMDLLDNWLTRYLLTQARHWLLLGHTQSALYWLKRHPDHNQPNNPQHQLLLLWALVYDCQYSAAEQLIDALHSQWDKHLEWPARWRQQLRVELEAVGVLLHIFKHDLNAVSAETNQRLKHYLEVPSDHQAMLICVYTFLLFMNGRYDKARLCANKATQIGQTMRNPFSQSVATLLICLCDRAIGRFDLALQTITKAHRDYDCYENTPAWSCVALVQALFHYELNQIEPARYLLLQALPNLSMSPITEFNVHGYLTLCLIHALYHDQDSALNATDVLLSRLTPYSLTRWKSSVQHEQARLALLNNHLNQAKQLTVMALGNPLAMCTASRTRYCPAVGHVPSRTALMIALYERNFDAANEALGQLSQVCLLHQDNLLRIILLSSTSVYEFGRESTEEAMEYLNQALRLAQTTGMFRALFDEVFGFGDVFQYGLDNCLIEEDIGSALITQLVRAQFCQPAQRPSHRTYQELQDSLTETELRIISWLAEGHSNKAISEKSNIAVTTTKWHLRNIYDKLSASNRTEAVHKAKAFRLIKS